MQNDPIHDEAVRKLFNESSENYASLFLPKKTGKNFAFRKRLVLVSEAAQQASGQLFDCATGSGEVSTAILAKGRFERATLLDISPRMLDLVAKQINEKLARNIASQIELIRENIFCFAPKDENCKYDCILCLGLIAHTGRLKELLVLLRGLLVKDGIILLQSTLLDHFGTRVERFFSEERFFRKHGYKITYYRHQDVTSACADAGLEIFAHKRFSLGLPFGDHFWGWGNYQLELFFQRWAEVHGSEAIYVLKADGKA